MLVLGAKTTILMNDFRLTRSDRKVRFGFQNHIVLMYEFIDRHWGLPSTNTNLLLFIIIKHRLILLFIKADNDTFVFYYQGGCTFEFYYQSK